MIITLTFGVIILRQIQKVNSLDPAKKDYIKKLIGLIEIFENNQNIKDIETKFQGAILFILINFLDCEKINSIATNGYKNNMDDRNIIKMLISSINPNN